MVPCLCAPTTHEGSFRCRLHRGLPVAITPAQLAPPHQKGAPLSSREISVDKPCPVRIMRESPSPATPLHQVSFQLHTPSSSSSSSSSSPLPTPPSPSSSSPPPFRHARPPPARRAISSPGSPSRSSNPGSSANSSTTSITTAPSRCRGPSISHAAALAIMKQHMHNKNSRSHLNRSNTVPRSSAGYKIGPSRLSRMGRACGDEVPVLKKVDCSISNLPPHNAFPLKTNSFNSVEPEARQSTSTSRINLKMHSVVAKFKQNESSCKLVGYKAGPFIVPTVY